MLVWRAGVRCLWLQSAKQVRGLWPGRIIVLPVVRQHKKPTCPPSPSPRPPRCNINQPSAPTDSSVESYLDIFLGGWRPKGGGGSGGRTYLVHPPPQGSSSLPPPHPSPSRSPPPLPPPVNPSQEVLRGEGRGGGGAAIISTTLASPMRSYM